MFLKRIEMQGFKSFADKTIISFDYPITGIVGPNGCGKSTLLKSIANLIEYRGTIKFDGVDSNKYERKSKTK